MRPTSFRSGTAQVIAFGVQAATEACVTSDIQSAGHLRFVRLQYEIQGYAARPRHETVTYDLKRLSVEKGPVDSRYSSEAVDPTPVP